MRKNPKKVITSCQFKVVRSECPAIKNVRSVRNRLNKLVLEQADPELIEKMRTALKNAKTGDAKKNQCAHCHHAEKANA